MTVKNLIKNIVKSWTIILGIIGSIGPISLLFGYLSKFFSWGNQFFFIFLRENYVVIWLISLTIIALVLAVWLIILNRRFLFGFSDSFKKRLDINWDYIGPWKIIDDNTLLVTGSDEGGITKKGADWENYSLTFKAKITSSCLGVIVRARDLNNYYMIQINKNAIVPHYRVSYPQIIKGSQDSIIPPIIHMQVGWQVFNDSIVHLNRELLDWFIVCIVVRGQSITLKIDQDIILQKDLFLQISKGKIGFRCHGAESAQIRDIRVRLDN
jgi:hypothetical protein